MPIIQGSHSGSSKLKAATQASALAAAAPADAAFAPAQDVPIANRSFGYLTIDKANVDPNALLPSNNPQQVIDALKLLGAAMIEDSDTETEDSIIPPVYTYWGQFIDHDITAGTDRSTKELFSSDILDKEFEPVAPGIVVGDEGLVNLRLPELDLDSVYGDGPTDPVTQQAGIFQDDVHLAVGRNFEQFKPSEGRTPNPHLPQPLERDLPRNANLRAKVADDRNDENLIIAQFHTAFLRFHNKLVDSLPGKPDFAEASRLVRWHYQWLVVNDYLRTICKDGIVDEILFSDQGFFPSPSDRFMPLEFSLAGYRFGHSMVRAFYDFNMNFGRGDTPLINNAPFNLLFQFTGLKGDLGKSLGSQDNLPNHWIIEWDRFTDKNSPHTDRFARKIDTNLALPLTEIPADTDPNTGVQPPLATLTDLQKHLAQRNLLRSYLLSLPTGQTVAAFFGVEPLSESDLVPANKSAVANALNAEGGLLKQKTPLWYYILREAEVQTKGNSLGEVGSRLVAGTLIGLLKADPNSYLNAPGGWNPSQGVKVVIGEKIKPIVRIMDFFRFAGVA